MALKIAFLVPVYNEKGRISNLIKRLSNERRDIIVIDDGSKDGTAKEIESTGIILLKHPSNMGKGAALKTGFIYAIANNYDYVITLDGDGQHKTEESRSFLKSLQKARIDILVGTRTYSCRNMPLDRFLTNLTTSLVVSILANRNIRDSQSGYRAISARVMRNVKLRTSNYQTESEILIKSGRLGYSIGSVPISTIYGVGKSKIRPIRDTLRFIKLVFNSLWA